MNEIFPFKIGSEYELYEFDLEVIEIERTKGLDSYLYLREIEFLGSKAKQVELIFSIDILQIVIIHLENITFIYGNKELIEKLK
jgi:hypothetical protein